MEPITKEWLASAVPSQDTTHLNEGVVFIAIDKVEDLLDQFDTWGTQNFNFYLYKGEGYGSLGIAASLEVVIEYTDECGRQVKRTFVGACNFNTKAIHPNTHFLATAKSECVKNAISDIGRRFGRGLNAALNVVPNPENVKDANAGVEMPTNLSDVKLKTNAKKI